MREIEAALGPLLKVLRLKMRQETWSINECIVFEREGEGKWRSPVEFVFPDQYTSERAEASWEDASLSIMQVDTFPIGTTGWTAHESSGRNLTPWRGEEDDILQRAASLLRSLALWPTSELPNVLNSSHLTYAWTHALNDEFDYQGITEIDIGRNEVGNESCFYEHDGRSFELRFALPDAILFADGNEVSRCCANQLTKIGGMVNWHIIVPDIPSPWR